MKKYLTLAFLLAILIPSMVDAQPRRNRNRGGFSGDWLINESDYVNGAADSTMIDSVSLTYDAWPTMTVEYLFIDVGTVATTLYFEKVFQGTLTLAQTTIIDSLVVSTTSTIWRSWQITDTAVSVTERFRIRKSATTDTVMLIFNGFNGDK